MASRKGDRDPSDRRDYSDPVSPAASPSTPTVRAEEEEQRGQGSTVQSRQGTNYGSIDSSASGLRTSGNLAESTIRSEPALATSSNLSTSDRAKQPPTLRRLSSKRPGGPHRGQEFSIHDDVTEFEEDVAARTQSSPRMRPMQSTLRRRQTGQPSMLPRVTSEDTEDGMMLPEPGIEDHPDENSSENGNGQIEDEDEDAGDISDAESFTLKDRQQAINQTHPFGIRIWKPALYKKNRSVEKSAEGDIHSTPGARVGNGLFLINLLWTLLFGWWLALAALVASVVCFVCAFSPGATAYGRVFLGLSAYLFYPFGSFVRLETDDNYAEEDEGEGRSISEYEQWQSGDLEHGRLFFGPTRSLVGRRRNSIESASENDSLLGRTGRNGDVDNPMSKTRRRLFGRGEWSLGRVVFYFFFYFLVGPLMLLVSGICWMMVFWIPMARLNLILFYHLQKHPLALSFSSDTSYTRSPSTPSSSILLCTYRAAGLQYWKYTVDGTNVFFINLLGVVAFVVVDYWLLREILGLENWLTHPGLIFSLSLLSVIPLAYFIGQAVASISAQSSMGMGAAVNAFFSTVVEVYLYCVALNEGKGKLVEGSIIGSLFAGILFLPGLSMCFGATRRKTQRFNARSAGVTTTMLLFAMIAAFGPTLFYQVYGSHELNCVSCARPPPHDSDCRRCYFSQLPTLHDNFYLNAVQPYCYFSAILLFLSYIVGLWFTLRTHAAVIWTTEADEKKGQSTIHDSGYFEQPRAHNAPPASPLVPTDANGGRKDSIRESALYKRILGQSLKQAGLSPDTAEGASDPVSGNTPHVVPPKEDGSTDQRADSLRIPGLSEEQNQHLARQVAELAATAAAVAARDAGKQRKGSYAPQGSTRAAGKPLAPKDHPDEREDPTAQADNGAPSGGHDAPNWGKTKSSVILLVATIFYAVIAEMLVNTVDVVLQRGEIDEKFLGITLFALVPNTTEFLNAISFAMNGNIALSMEIGSAYALQVCLLQIPALVLYSAIKAQFIDIDKLRSHTFKLIFPQWDMIAVILCVFLLSHMYSEGKSNYFKGSILVLAYFVVLMGFYFSGFNAMRDLGVDPNDTLALGANPMFAGARAGLDNAVGTGIETFRTVGRSWSGGVAY